MHCSPVLRARFVRESGSADKAMCRIEWVIESGQKAPFRFAFVHRIVVHNIVRPKCRDELLQRTLVIRGFLRQGIGACVSGVEQTEFGAVNEANSAASVANNLYQSHSLKMLSGERALNQACASIDSRSASTGSALLVSDIRPNKV